ncbi:monooxygenase, partial [Paraburkholderia sp. BR10936]
MTALNLASTVALAPVLSPGTDYERLASRFRPVFARIAEGVLER